jgi:hypothetical protein
MPHRDFIKKIMWLLIATIGLLPVAGCHHASNISDISQRPEAFKDRDVQIHGRVVSSFSFPSVTKRGFYVVNDGTGQMGVYSDAGPPEQNSEVTVTGDVQDIPPVGLPAIKQFKLANVMLHEKARDLVKQ